jgi:hypothetical protein
MMGKRQPRAGAAVDKHDARIALKVEALSSLKQVFDEYNGGSSVGWIAHRFGMDETVVRQAVETQLRLRLEQCIKGARTTPKRVHISLVTAPLSWKGR